jgi:hypothetical protein
VNPANADLLDRRLAAGTAAEQQAARHWAGNLRALVQTQPHWAQSLAGMPAGIEWVYARDGSLTGRDANGWLAGCSLPLRAAAAMLRNLKVDGVVACSLAPSHGAQIQAALDKLDAAQAVIALLPELSELRIALGCFDFSQAIERHRLWLVAGPEWETQFKSLFDQQPGLPTPTQFIRAATVADEVIDRLIPLAQRIISQVTTERIHQAASLVAERSARTTSAGTLGIAARSQFRLWNNAGTALADLFAATAGAYPYRHLDLDDPACASGLALARLAGQCDAIVTVDLPRCGLGAMVGADVPLVTWLTTPAVPPFAADAPRDGLILADAAWKPAALKAGWPESRLAIAAWPALAPLAPAPPPGTAPLTLIADTHDLETPKQQLTLSSHHLLWELIREELLKDPLQVDVDLDRYLAQRRKRLGISDQGFNLPLFVERLVIPAYQQGLARKLRAAGLPPRIFGAGWDNLPEFRDLWAGLVRTADELRAIVQGAAALVYAWPLPHAHQLDALGRPVLRSAGRSYESLIRNAKGMLAGTINPAPTQAGPPLAVETVLRLLGKC